MTDMRVEAAAIAIWIDSPDAWHTHWRDLNDRARQDCRRVARAAIAAADAVDPVRVSHARLLEASAELSNFAWTAVRADCDEARDYLNDLIREMRDAILAALRADISAAEEGVEG